MIEIRDIKKSFGTDTVLSSLSCTIKKGSIYGLVGANGAGKSTLLRLIAGIYYQDAGDILVDGEPTFDNDLIKQRIAFISDDYFYYPNYTLAKMAHVYQSVYCKFDYNYFIRLCEIFKLNKDKSLNSFSKGMKRQAAIILALSTNADYYLFDETFDGLDPVMRNLVKRIICDHVAEQGTTVILTSHNLRELEDICDHLGLLYKGGILFESEIDSLKTKMFKVQISLEDKDFNKDIFNNMEILNYKKIGSVATIIIKGDKEKIISYLKTLNPIILDIIPLTLEEVFIYEMEVLGYEFNNEII